MVKINLKKASQIAVVAVCRIKSKTYRVTTADEKQLISDQIAHLDKKIKTERDQNILTKLEEQRASCGLDLPMRTLKKVRKMYGGSWESVCELSRSFLEAVKSRLQIHFHSHRKVR